MGIPILGPLITAAGKSIFKGIGKIAAPVVTGLFGALGQDQTNEANAREAAENREFQAAEAQKSRDFTNEQSSTAIQRRVKDLEAAGLNPALAYQGGADTGASAMASGSQSHSMQSAAGAGINSALAAFEFAQSVQDRQAQRLNTNIDSAQKKTNLLLQPEQVKLERAEIASRIANNEASFKRIMTYLEPEVSEMRSRTRLNNARSVLDELDVPRASAFGNMYKTAYGKSLPYMTSASDLVGDAAQTISLGRYLNNRVLEQSSRPRTVNHYHRRVP